MGGSAGKLAVIVTAVFAGVLLIAKGFDGDPSGPGGQGTDQSSTPATSTTPPQSTEPPVTACEKAGVGVQVFNGTSISGLAAFATGEIDNAGEGWVTIEPGNTEPIQQTVVYFRTTADKPAAQCLVADFFPGAQAKRLPEGFAGSVADEADIAVVLGNDYALANPLE